MNRINDISGRVSTLPDTENGTREAGGKPLYQPGVALQPTYQKLTVLASPMITTASPAATPGETTIPNVNNMPYYRQTGNSCGTTTLAEIMTYLGVSMKQADIDGVIRQMNTFTAPQDMIRFAKDHGLSAEGYNNGDWDQVKAMLDEGHPVQAMVNGDSSVSVTDGNGNQAHFSVDGLHYIAITGHGTDPATGEEYVIYHDPNRLTEQRMPVSDFEKMWGNTDFGYHNYFIAYGPNGANLPPGNNDGIQGAQGAASGLTNFTNGISLIYPPSHGVGGVVHGLLQSFGGFNQGLVCGCSALAQMGVHWLNQKVDGIPILANVVQPLGDAVDGACAAVADVANGFGESFNDAGDAFEKLCDGNFKGFAEKAADSVGDVIGGAADAVKDSVKSVGHAIKSFFHGW